jgi:glycosyltransferase involved in cell wall biosynthesis
MIDRQEPPMRSNGGDRSGTRADISVVIPCYNAAPFLEEALESVLEQSRRPLEVLVVDDRSTDDSFEVAQRYASRHPLVRVLRHERNQGSGPARNTGAEAARGSVIAFLDADDRWDPSHLEVVGGLLDRYPEAALAATHAAEFGDGENPFLHGIPPGGPRRMHWEALSSWIVPQNAVAVRTDAFHAVGGYDPGMRLSEDFDFVLRLAWRYPFVGSDRCTVGWRRHPGQQSEQKDAQRDALRRHQAAFTNRLRGQVSPQDHARMRDIVIRTWWDDVRELVGRPERFRSLLAEGPPDLTHPSARELLRIQSRRLLGTFYLSQSAGPVRALYQRSLRLVRWALGKKPETYLARRVGDA